MNAKRILLVEDDVSLRFALESYLTQQSQYDLKTVGTADAAKEQLTKSEFDLVVSDVKLPGGSGDELVGFIQSGQAKNRPCVILISGFGSIEDAVDAMKNGASDFLVKPFAPEELHTSIESALERQMQNLVRLSQLSVQVPQETSDDGTAPKREHVFITNNPKMQSLIENLKKVASSKATVLVQGESGTGKEVLANMIHKFSPRSDHPFIAINCAALPDNLLESELFGHEKGSFTGAIQRQIGKFELSDGGTILLDEISEMSLNMQTKLLRVLQECEVYRIGGNKPIPLNLRVVASTNRDLYQYMKEGNFREDLYYRINVIPIHVPPLRERGEDVIVLAEHFLEEFSRTHERPPMKLDELARYKILNHPWYGNVRELRNAMERAVLVRSFDQIIHEEIGPQESNGVQEARLVASNPSNAQSAILKPGVDMTLDEVEKRVIYEMLRRCEGNRTRTAEKLGISLRTLRNKLKTFKTQEDSQLQS